MHPAPSPFLTKSVFTPEYAHFAARIVELRKEAGLTQAELAQLLGRPQSYVSKYERGERRLDVVEFLAVARALGTDAASFVAELEQLKGKPVPGAAARRPRGRSGGPPPQRRS
jgi:transcriptional regulator with XRE-family HTH domain